MTKKQQADFYRRLDAINRRAIRRSYAVAEEALRQMEALRREYQKKQFDSIPPADSRPLQLRSAREKLKAMNEIDNRLSKRPRRRTRLPLKGTTP
jgi:hypothetical protein